MKNKGTTIANGFGLLVMVVGMILGVVYILTGNSFDGKFIGHIINANHFNDSEMPEVLAFASMGVMFVGLIISLIAMAISQKGLSKPEKQEVSKQWSIFLFGIILGVIAAVVLAVIAPKQEFGYEYKSMTWYWIILVVEASAAITMIVGFVKGIKNSRGPLISRHNEAINSSDEF